MANLSCTTTANYIHVYIENLDSDYSSDDRYCNITLSLDGVIVDSATAKIAPKVLSQRLTTFYGLTPNTTYRIQCIVTYPGGNPSFTASATTLNKTAYTANLYITEEGIDSVYVYSYGNGSGYSYGAGSSPTISQQTKNILFEATAATGYKFNRWEYRVGSATAPKQISTSNPFVYYVDSAMSDLFIKPFAEKSDRPEDWDRWKTIYSDAGVNLYADEWNAFCERINEFRVYKNLPEYSFTTAVSGVTDISASICNQAWNAINAISEHGTMPAAAVSDGDMYASFFTGLMEALNAIE